MPLTEDEIEMLARRRMLKNVLNDIIAVTRSRDPELAEDIDRILEEYETEAARQCSDVRDAEAVIDCIMEVKQDREPDVRAELNRLG